MKNTFFSLISIAALAVIFSACKKQDNVAPDYGINSSTLRTGSLCEACADGCELAPDSVIVYSDTVSWDGSAVPNPAATIYYFDFTTGTRELTNGQIQMGGMFNSFFKGHGCWKTGYFSRTFVYDALNCASLRDSVLYDVCTGGLGQETFSCTGWYEWNISPTSNWNPIRSVAIFCDDNDNDIWDTNEKGYVLKVKRIEEIVVPKFPYTFPLQFILQARFTFTYTCCPAVI